MTITASGRPRPPSPLSRLLKWLGVESPSAKRRGEPQRYGKGDDPPLASDVIKTLVAASPWFAAQVPKGLNRDTALHIVDWIDHVGVHTHMQVRFDLMDEPLQRAITLIGKAHGLHGDGRAMYDMTGIGPSSATLRAALRSVSHETRAKTAREVETHLLRMGIDPKDAIWHALGIRPSDDPWSGSIDMKSRAP